MPVPLQAVMLAFGPSFAIWATRMLLSLTNQPYMKNTNHTHKLKSTGALLALAITTLSASAQNVPNPASGDVFLGFRSPSTSVSYLVDIGQASQFINATPGTSFTLGTIGDIGSDLTANFGSWSSSSTVYWGIFGANSSAAPSLYVSKARTSPGTQSAPWNGLASSDATATKSQIYSVIYGPYGYQGAAATANSSVGALQTNFTGSGSYNYQVTRSGTDFGSLSQWSSIETNFSAGASSTVLDFYWIRSSTQSVFFIGTFTISSYGVVTFTAVPGSYSTTNDGRSDAEKVAAGVSIYTANDFPVIQSVQNTLSGISVQFQTAASRTYNVQYSTDLVTWTTVGTYTSGSTGALHTFLDTDAGRRSSPKAFYRLKISQ